MSRSLIAALFLSTAMFSASASADRSEPSASPHFAQPPPHAMIVRAPIDRVAVRAKLADARAANLARFRAYQRKGVFPSNTFAPGKLNVWRDDAGHLCAAATIINASGQTALVNRVAEQNNFIRLADVSDGPLMDWILTSGFTQAEIAAIQEPFMDVGRAPINVEPDPLPEPEPEPVPVIDIAKRKAEDQRLRGVYRTVTSRLVRDRNSSLDVATDRLMAQPELAARLLRS